MKKIDFEELLLALQNRINERENKKQIAIERGNTIYQEIIEKCNDLLQDEFSKIDLKDQILTYGILEDDSIWIPSPIALSGVYDLVTTTKNSIVDSYRSCPDYELTPFLLKDFVISEIVDKLWDSVFQQYLKTVDINIESSLTARDFINSVTGYGKYSRTWILTRKV